MVYTKLNLKTLYFMLRVSVIHDFISPYVRNTAPDQYLYMRPSFPEMQLLSSIPVLANVHRYPFTVSLYIFHLQFISFIPGHATLWVAQP